MLWSVKEYCRIVCFQNEKLLSKEIRCYFSTRKCSCPQPQRQLSSGLRTSPLCSCFDLVTVQIWTLFGFIFLRKGSPYLGVLGIKKLYNIQRCGLPGDTFDITGLRKAPNVKSGTAAPLWGHKASCATNKPTLHSDTLGTDLNAQHPNQTYQIL